MARNNSVGGSPGLADSSTTTATDTFRVCSVVNCCCGTVGMACFGQRHKLRRPEDVGDGFDGFPQQHRHCTPQPQRHCVDEAEAFPRTSSPLGMAENCQARTPTEMRSRLDIGIKSISQIAYQGKPLAPL